VRVGPETDERAQRCEDERDGDHQRHERCWKPKLHDHHPIERTREQYGCHADRHLEQRQAQDTA
jgi:hypothetical protein